MDFWGNRKQTLRQYQQSRIRRGDMIVILLVLILTGMWLYYLGAHFTGFSVLESSAAGDAAATASSNITILTFENQSLPLGTMLEVTIDGKKYQKDISLLLQPPYEIFYENATVYGWNEPLAIDFLSLVPDIALGTHIVDATLSANGVMLTAKTMTVTIAAPEKEAPVQASEQDEPEQIPEKMTIPTKQDLAQAEETLAQAEETPVSEEISEQTFAPFSGPLFSTAVGAEGTRNWDKNETSAQTKNDQFFAVASDTLSNIYAVGVGVNLTQECTSAVNCDDMWIKKFSSAGVENTSAWNKTAIKGIANGVAVDNSTNSVYVVGYYRGGFGNNNWWIRKFTETGTENTTAWNKSFSGAGNVDDRATAVTVDSLGSVYVVGYGTNIAGASSSLDWWIKKFTEIGTENTSPWNINFTSGGSANDAALAVDTDSNNNVYVVGYGTAINITSSGDNWWIKKFTETGTENTTHWNITYTSPGSASDRARGVAVDSGNFVYVAGYAYNATTNCAGSTKCREWMLKSFRETGVENTTSWNITFNSNGSQHDEAAAIAIDKNDNIYVAGFGFNTSGTCSGTNCEDWWLKKLSTAAVENTVSWNRSLDGAGNDEAFGVVADGIFNVTAIGYLTTSGGNQDLWIVQLIGNSSAGGGGGGADTTAPTVTMVDPASGALANFSERSFNFTWNVSDNLATTLDCNLTILNSTSAPDQYKIFTRGVNNGTTVNKSFSASSFVNATLNWTVNCSDGTNTGTAGAGRTFTIDLSPPTVNIMEPQNVSGFNTGTDAINFSFNTTDAQDSALNCNMTIGNGSDYKLINFLTSGNGVTNQSYYVDNFTNSTHNWTVNCTNDASGVTNGGIRFFTVDRAAPTVNMIAPSDNTFYNFSTGEPNFTWNVTDDVNLTMLCNLSVANGSANFRNISTQSTNGTLSNRTYLSGDFTNASHTWLVTCTDAGGNVGASTSRTFTIDQHPPMIAFVNPANNFGFNFSDAVINFTFNANDTLDATLDCNITVGNGSNYKLINIQATNGSLANFSLFANNFTNSTHNWTVNCTDAAGGINTSGIQFFTVDQQPPFVTLQQPSDNTLFNFSDGMLNFTWNITEDVNTTALCNLSIANGSANFKNITVQTTNNTLTNFSLYANNFTNASHTWFVACTDNAQGHGNSSSRTFTIDQHGPAMVFVSPSNNSLYNFSNAILNFTVNVTDTLDGTLSCNLTISNSSTYKVVNFDATNASFANYSFFAGNFTNTTHNWSVNCTDNAGNINISGAQTFTVDRHGPAIVLIYPANGSLYNFTTAELNFTFIANDTLDGALSCNLTIGNGSDYKLVNLDATNGTLTNFSLFSGNFTEAGHNWSINCTDDAGNVNASGRFNFTLDQTRSAVTTVAPRNAATKASGTLIEVAANVSDSVGVSVVLANLTWPNGTQENKTLSFQSGNNYNNSYTAPNLTGTLNLTITANDTSGNVNITEGVNITLTDQTNPVLTNASPSNGSSKTKDTTIQLSINVTDNINISNVSINITYPNGSVIQKSANNPSAAFFNTSLALQSEGVHNITFAANDTADNRQTIGINFNSTSTEVCQTLTGSKNLTGNVAATGSGVCILVNTTSNVLFNCKGFNITSDGTAGSISIRVYNSSNVNISNCGIQNFDKAIEFINATASSVNNNLITNSTSKDIVVNQSTKPAITNTTAASTEVQDVTGFEVEDERGKITFLTSFNSSVSNISQIVQVGDGVVFVNSSAAPSLNRSANITMTNLTRFIGKIIEIQSDFEDDGIFTVCNQPTCTIISFSETTGTLLFNVSRFSKYRVGEGTSSSVGGGDRGARTIRGTTGSGGGGSGGGGGGGGSGQNNAPAATEASEPAAPSSFLGAITPPVPQEIKQAVSEGLLQQFGSQLAPEIRLPPVPEGANYAWLIPLLLPLLLAVTSISVPTPRRVFCDEDTLYQLIRTKKIFQYKKLYITQAMKQKLDSGNHYANLIPVSFSNNERYLINYLCDRSATPRVLVELLFAAQKKKHAKIITTVSIPAMLQARFGSVRIVSPVVLEQKKSSPFAAAWQARPLFLRALPGMLSALRLKKQQKQQKQQLVDASLLDYIINARAKGIVAEELANRLSSRGWNKEAVSAALAQSDARLAALYNYVEQAKSKGLDDDRITKRIVRQGWRPSAVRAALQSIEIAFSELLAYVRRAKQGGISPLDVVKRLTASGWDEKVVAGEVRRFNAALSKLVSYVSNARIHGLSSEEIQQRLVNFGWDHKEATEQLLLVQLCVEQLASYIRQAKASGVPSNAILQQLTALGWSRKEISQELKELGQNEKSLLAYMRHAKATGVPDVEIKKRLLDEGWDIALVEADLHLIAEGTRQLVEYAATARQSGIGDETTVSRLVSGGWEEADVRQELERFKNSLSTLVQYVTEAHITGVPDCEIRHRLKETGWDAKDIASAFQLAALSSPPAEVSGAA